MPTKRTNKKNKGGRPTKITGETVRKLEEGFKMDFTVTEACSYAQISRDIYYKALKKDKEFSDKMQSAQNFIFYAAKKNIAKAIIKDGSIEDAKWLLRRRQKEIYAERAEITGAEGSAITFGIKDLLNDTETNTKEILESNPES